MSYYLILGIISISVIGLLSLIYWLPKTLIIVPLENNCKSVLFRNKSSKNIALTFDDVPYGYHKKIAKILDKYDMKGTFFIISGQVNETNKTSLIELIKNGHELANHGSTDSMHILKNENDLKKEIDECNILIKNLYEEANIDVPNPIYYRPGCGYFGPKMIKMIDDNKINKIVLGSIYPHDPQIRSEEINFYYITNRIEVGDLIILHDRKWTSGLLKKLLPWLLKNNMDSMTLANYNKKN